MAVQKDTSGYTMNICTKVDNLLRQWYREHKGEAFSQVALYQRARRKKRRKGYPG